VSCRATRSGRYKPSSFSDFHVFRLGVRELSGLAVIAGEGESDDDPENTKERPQTPDDRMTREEK